MLAETKTGQISSQDGSVNSARADRVGALVTTQAHGAFTESVVRGGVMEACNTVAGIAPGTVLAVAPPIALWNPPGSGKNLTVLKTSMGYISGTFGAGSVMYGYIPSQVTVPTTGAEITPNNTLIGAPRGVGRVFAGSTFVSVPVPLRAGFIMGAFAGGANPPVDTVDVVDGSIVIPPGTAFIMQAVAGAGTSPLALFGIMWEEMPI